MSETFNMFGKPGRVVTDPHYAVWLRGREDFPFGLFQMHGRIHDYIEWLVMDAHGIPFGKIPVWCEENNPIMVLLDRTTGFRSEFSYIQGRTTGNIKVTIPVSYVTSSGENGMKLPVEVKVLKCERRQTIHLPSDLLDWVKGGGLDICVDGFGGNPEEVEPTQVRLEIDPLSGALAIHVWDGKTDPTTFSYLRRKFDLRELTAIKDVYVKYVEDALDDQGEAVLVSNVVLIPREWGDYRELTYNDDDGICVKAWGPTAKTDNSPVEVREYPILALEVRPLITEEEARKIHPELFEHLRKVDNGEAD